MPMSTFREQTVASTSDRSLRRSRAQLGATRRTVLVALASNLVVLLAKLVGGVMSGSAALLAEAAHSVADTTNQAFLLLSISLSTREPTPEQPFGFGRARFLWTFIAAMAMFLAGAVFAIGMGGYELVSGESSDSYLAVYIPLAIGAVAEGSSLTRAIRQTRREARENGLSLLRHVRSSRDPNVKMVVSEDSAAVIGIVIAFAGVLADQLSGARVFDPIASILIGVLLVCVAVWMAHDVSELLIGASARPQEREAITRTLEEFAEIDRVLEVLTMVLGPNSLLVAARVDYATGLDDARLEAVSERIDERLREVVPDVTEVFLDATTAPRGRQPG